VRLGEKSHEVVWEHAESDAVLLGRPLRARDSLLEEPSPPYNPVGTTIRAGMISDASPQLKMGLPEMRYLG
jgi:hypothetical protein